MVCSILRTLDNNHITSKPQEGNLGTSTLSKDLKICCISHKLMLAYRKGPYAQLHALLPRLAYPTTKPYPRCFDSLGITGFGLSKASSFF